MSLLRTGGSFKRVVLGALLLVAALAALTLAADDARAGTAINHFAVTSDSPQAGGHPNVLLELKFDNRGTENGQEIPEDQFTCCEDAKEIKFSFPTGFIGNPHSVPTCTLAQFSLIDCPPDSQVGLIALGGFFGYVPLFNMQPHPDEAGLQGVFLPVLNAPSFIELSARTGSDYGLDALNEGIFHILPINELNVVLWGVPAEARNDAYRFPPKPDEGPPQECLQVEYPELCFGPNAANVPPQPYLQNPTRCGVPLTVQATVTFYSNDVTTAMQPWPAMSGCDQLVFNPTLTAKPTTEQSDAPSGLDVNLKVPQTQNATTPSPSELRSTTVTLPEGFSINPNAADGKEVCTDAQAMFGTEDAARCPEFAKVGSLSINSSALPASLPGAIYLGEPKPGDPYRLILVADGFATHVKLPGSVHADPQTGRLVVEFDELPQTPLQEFDMHFFGSERGLLATPRRCGTYEVVSVFEPWAAELSNQESTAFFTVSSGPNGRPCPGSPEPFSPRLRAGTANNTAGMYSPLSVEIERDDGDQLLSGIDVTLPPGLVTSLRGVSYCPEASIARAQDPLYEGIPELTAPACPGSSQVGSVMAVTGAGSKPLNTPGRVFLAGPYKAAPLSLVVVVPGVSGPYDLGNIAVRVAANVDPTTARISTSSDPLPTILDGIPLRIRRVALKFDRPKFSLNPTNCDHLAFDASILGDGNTRAVLSPHFQVANCADLGFAPKLEIRLSGNMKRRGHPALRADVTARAGESNIDRVQVTLPPTAQLDQSNVSGSCTRVQFAADSCPASSLYGSARAHTPLFDAPLAGPVYLVAGDNKLPDLVAALDGQVEIDLRGRISSHKGGLRTTFATVPDAPFTSFSLNMKGGSEGLLVSTRNLCKARPSFAVRMRGQNDGDQRLRPKLRLACGKKARSKSARLYRARRAR